MSKRTNLLKKANETRTASASKSVSEQIRAAVNSSNSTVRLSSSLVSNVIKSTRKKETFTVNQLHDELKYSKTAISKILAEGLKLGFFSMERSGMVRTFKNNTNTFSVIVPTTKAKRKYTKRTNISTAEIKTSINEEVKKLSFWDKLKLLFK